DGSIAFVVGANTLDLRAPGATASSFQTGAGVAVPLAGVTQMVGGISGRAEPTLPAFDFLFKSTSYQGDGQTLPTDPDL
ncbi:MAG: hypothetical protein MUO62_14800, partial [Anaerolineales bacterium]|nr:hypothetical protein [Anaerolineales bacterium]